MKRMQRIKSIAQQKNKSSINNSKAKAQYSFSKSQRFPKNFSSVPDLKYYDLPSQKSKRNTTFGIGKRPSFVRNINTPPPTKYNITSYSQWNLRNSKFSFKSNRQQCKNNQIFRLNNNPGPGQYDPTNKFLSKSSEKYSLGQRPKQPQNKKQIPGPKYKIQSTLLDTNKFLSIYKKRNSTKMCPPREQMVKNIMNKTFDYRIQQDNRIINSKGFRNFGKDARKTFISTSKRFENTNHSDDIPGPGSYQKFSQFIDLNQQDP